MIYSRTYPNGLTLLAEPMPYLKSCAFSLDIPAGVGYEQPSRRGIASFVCEMALRGCGRWNSRQFMEDLQSFGVDRGEKVGIGYTSYYVTLPATNLFPVLEIYASLAQQARFESDSLEPSRQSVILERLGIEDDPGLLIALNARKDFFPDPWGENSYGNLDVLQSATMEELKKFYSDFYRPDNTVLSVAGNFDWDELQKKVELFFEPWQSKGPLQIIDKAKPRQDKHIDYKAQQTQIIIAFDGIPYSHPDYYKHWSGISALGGGTSGRLFTQLRERRGLCYSVAATYYCLPRHAAVFCSVETSTENTDVAKECLMAEINQLKQGISLEELNRVKVRARTSLIMEQESCSSRAMSLAGDWMNLKYLPTLEQRCARIESLTLEGVNEYLAQHAPTEFQTTMLG